MTVFTGGGVDSEQQRQTALRSAAVLHASCGTLVTDLPSRTIKMLRLGLDAQFAAGGIRAGLFVHNYELLRALQRSCLVKPELFLDGQITSRNRAATMTKELSDKFDGLPAHVVSVPPPRYRQLRMWFSRLGKLDVFYHVYGGVFPAIPGRANAYLIPDVIPLALDYPLAGLREYARSYYDRAVMHGDVLFVYSEHTKRDIVERLGARANRIVVTPLAAGDQFLQPRNVEAVTQYLATLGLRDTPYFLAVGTLEPRKNLETLVRAFAQLKRRDSSLRHKLVLVGSKWVGFEPIFQAIEQEGVEHDVVYLGRAERVDLLYHGATAFVFPSVYEGFGLPPLEAMAAGVPVIAANATSVPEVVSDAGMLFEPKDVGGLAEAMGRVVQDPQLHAELRMRGLKRAAEFSWDRTAAAFYDGLLLAMRNYRSRSN